MLALLLLIPMVFDFSGTWQRSTGDIAGIEIQVGDPLEGSFTFERLGDDTIAGELSFAIGSLVFQPLWVAEYPDTGWGSLGGITAEQACNTWRGDLACLVSMSFSSPQNTGCGADGQDCHYLAIWGVGDGFSIGPLASSRNVHIDPFLPFAVLEQYYVPEPATIMLVGSGLLWLLWRRRHP